MVFLCLGHRGSYCERIVLAFHLVMLVDGCPVYRVGAFRTVNKFTTHGNVPVLHLLMLIEVASKVAEHRMDQWFAKGKSGCFCSRRSHFCTPLVERFGSTPLLRVLRARPNIFLFQDSVSIISTHLPIPLSVRTLILVRQPLRYAANRPIRIEVFSNHAVFIQRSTDLLRRTSDGA